MIFKVTIFWIRFLTFFFSKLWLFVAITFWQIVSKLRTTMDIRGLYSATFSMHVLTNNSVSILRFKTCSWLTFPHFKGFCNSISAANPRWPFFVSTRFFSFCASLTNAEVWASSMTLGFTINPSKDTTLLWCYCKGKEAWAHPLGKLSKMVEAIQPERRGNKVWPLSKGLQFLSSRYESFVNQGV